MTLMMNDITVTPCVNDKVIQQLLLKLEEGSETIINLRSLLTLKTVELNEILSQLKLIDQVLTRVEHGTERIENIIQGVLSCTTNQDDKLLDAEATLDSALKSACSLYSIDKNSSMLNKINQILIELNIATSIDKYKQDDTNVLQKAYHDLNLAKNLAASIHSNYKLRTTLIKKKSPPLDKIKQVGVDIKKQVVLFKSYTRDSPFMINNKDIISILDREEKSLQQQINVNNKNHRQHCVSSTTKKQNVQMSTLQSISRPTSSSMAKSKDKKSLPSNGPGSTLRLRNMLAKRNPALKMMTEQNLASSTVY